MLYIIVIAILIALVILAFSFWVPAKLPNIGVNTNINIKKNNIKWRNISYLLFFIAFILFMFSKYY